jgi:nucleoside-diphosphate kinase
MSHIERTLVVLKPDAVQRGIVGEIISRFERAGLKIVGIKMIAPDEEHFHKHYEEIGTLISRRGQHVYDVTLATMTDSPVLAMVLEGIAAIAHVRKMVGPTDPKEALPGTIRGDYSHVSRELAIESGRTLPNLIHASANQEEAEQELPLWFDEGEMHDYEPPYQATVHGRVPKQKD